MSVSFILQFTEIIIIFIFCCRKIEVMQFPIWLIWLLSQKELLFWWDLLCVFLCSFLLLVYSVLLLKPRILHPGLWKMWKLILLIDANCMVLSIAHFLSLKWSSQHNPASEFSWPLIVYAYVYLGYLKFWSVCWFKVVIVAAKNLRPDIQQYNWYWPLFI